MPKRINNPLEWLRQTEPVVNGLMQGKSNNYGTVTLTANAASTTVQETEGRISINSVILFMPTTANAATEYAGGSFYVSSTDIENKTFTITHANNAQADRSFRYVIIA
jgi:uncharacterized membrane protein